MILNRTISQNQNFIQKHSQAIGWNGKVTIRLNDNGTRKQNQIEQIWMRWTMVWRKWMRWTMVEINKWDILWFEGKEWDELWFEGMNEMDYGLKKMNEMNNGLKEMNDNMTEVEVMWVWVIIS